MKLNIENLFLIVGVGSIGKHHAKYIASIKQKFILIDPDINVLVWAKSQFKNNFHFFTSIPEAHNYVNNEKCNRIAIISNWGTQHFKTLTKLNDMGIKKFFIEKPIVNCMADLNTLSHLVKNNHVQLMSNFKWRNSGLYEKILKISKEHLGGDPSLISISGGAFGIVTNGIHYLDMAFSIFKSEPKSVVSDLINQNINPRSSELDFWEGSATWSFKNGRKLSINSSNQSSIAPDVQIICPKGKIVIHRDMSISAFRRDQLEINENPAITRLGVTKQIKEINFKPKIKNVNSYLINSLYQNNLDELITMRDISVTKNMLYCLASSALSKKLDLNEKLPNKYYHFQWKIS